jgi:hypothetical protein
MVENEVTHDQELLRMIRDEHRPTYGTGRFRTRYHRCHELAAEAMLRGHLPEGTLKVEGLDNSGESGIVRSHSWIELPSGQLWDPVTCRLDTINAIHISQKFTLAEVKECIVKTGHYGAWSIL